MRMMVPAFDWFNLDPEILSIGTCRALRLKRIGRTFFVESGNIRRWMDGRFEREEVEWKTVAISKGADNKKSYVDAMEFLADANKKVLNMIATDQPRSPQ